MSETHVLLATDGSDLAIEAAQRAIGLLSSDAKMTVLTVVPMVGPATEAMAAAPAASLTAVPDAEGLRAAQEASAERGRENLSSTVAALSVEADTRIEVGDPGPMICQVAAEDRFDLVVVGSHGAGFIRRALVGSVSNYVLHHAPCPVLVVRHEKGADGDAGTDTD